MNGPASRRRGAILVWQIALGLAFVLAWEWGAAAKLLDKFFFSRPSDVLMRVWQWISTGSIWGHLAVTFTEALLSFANRGILRSVVRVPARACSFDGDPARPIHQNRELAAEGRAGADFSPV